MDYTIKIGGEAGQGIQTVGDTLARVFSRSGYHVFTNQDYESRVRGGHNFFQIRVSDEPVMAPREKVDILVAFDKESISQHAKELTEQGQIVYDSSSIGAIPHSETDTPNLLDIPFAKLAVDHGGSRIMANTVATGAILGMLKMSTEILNDIISDTFRKKGEDVIKANIDAAAAGHDFAVKNCLACLLMPADVTKAKMLLTTIEAIGFGAIASGCKFYAAYPMTPSTGIMNYLAGKEMEYGIVVEQAEDEIAAINMALGASFAGVRAMTGTAGGGFALMVEGLSLAAMTETPVVIALGQRPAPATGLPTRTEQGDLLFPIFTSHGEFPRAVFAPGTPEQAFYLTNKAFELAEKYQIQAIIIFDQYLADAEWTYEGFDLDKITFHDYRVRGDRLNALQEYKRHAYTATGVSPLGIPGESKHLVVTDSDEHSEEGHIIEDAETRVKMVHKRLFRKLPLIKKEMSPPFLYGDSHPEIVITGWGSTYGVMKEAVDLLSKGMKIAMLHFSEIYPFPETEKFDYLSLLENARMTICIENNAGGQFAKLMRAETGYEFTAKINKYDGRPFILEGLTGEIDAHFRRL
ncbi:MAG: 2-oxoacid:acceptor oxidoreductase subunit alpha [Thermodesulfovibrionales bacterium]|jgi:2-oxoglutarate ferredoxin oxidoreductase subunit alpha